ncbi:EB domain-containing protein [Caenorhabditis elegans]|uniref:EB domain-containing protein n=1 Tax=Caenorhabditis elegans TaxID=6239 RepID=Q9XV23_CAEEL|nr:EB domain-containing protein [Caenorhabditis elegans]CAB04396.2 EB domain-containing protein [Caenorhabditis elegans]|eukprot:NP_507984.2 Uncharacterized protein CELE_F46B3.15 [Caenorhabditis elegans]
MFLCLLLIEAVGARVAPASVVLAPVDSEGQHCGIVECRPGYDCVGGKCVKDYPNSCTTIKCQAGYQCTIKNGKGGCYPVSNKSLDLCVFTTCPKMSSCIVVDGKAKCVPRSPPCTIKQCPKGQKCGLRNGLSTCVPEFSYEPANMEQLN